MKKAKTIGLVGLTITSVLNLVALLMFNKASAEFFSDGWWSTWFPSYIIWLVFTIIGFASSGFESYTKHNRLAIWQATHKQLLHDDTQYRKRFYSYLATIVCLSFVLLLFYLPRFGIRLFRFVVDVSIISCVTAMIVFLSVRQLLFQNRRIQTYLQSNHDT